MPRFATIRPIAPILAAETALWLGFGAVLPILPLYITSQGIDATTLGLIVAAWPASRLIAEPIFGWVADRRDRRVMMIAGLLGTAAVAPLPLLVPGALAFIALRALAGLFTAVYDPASRGYVMDAVPAQERAHAFGMYGTAQMTGFLLGPAFGGIGSAIVGGYGFPFVFCAVTLVAAAVGLALATRSRPVAHATAPAEPGAGTAGTAGEARPASLANRLLLAAMVVNLGTYFASGTYEVIWSLFMQHLGADVGLIGVSFAAFGIGVAVISPFAGRMIDRTGPLRFVLAGVAAVAIAGLTYPALGNPYVVIGVSVFEGAGIAFAGPALYTIVGRATPFARTSTAQGLFGAAGTLGFIVASLVAGALLALDIRLPFYAFVGGLLATTALGLLIGGRRLAGLPKASKPTGAPRAAAPLPAGGGARANE